MNHLDVGFNHGEDSQGTLYTCKFKGNFCLDSPYESTCGYSYSVINIYFDQFFPEGILSLKGNLINNFCSHSNCNRIEIEEWKRKVDLYHSCLASFSLF